MTKAKLGTTRERYLSALDEQGIEHAEQFLLNQLNSDSADYSTLIYHLWRFQRFNALQDQRHNLLRRFLSGDDLAWQCLELLYYLQEHRIGCDDGAGDGDDRSCAAIFGAMCARMVREGARAPMIQCGLVTAGPPHGDFEPGLPRRGEGDVDAAYAGMPEHDWLLLEMARSNRCRRHWSALQGDNLAQATGTTRLDPARCAEIYIGPYYFRELSEAQRDNARLPDSFRSPFRPGLRLLMNELLRRGWQIVPLLCWRGSLAPHARRLASLSFSYHTHGVIPGRVHYKFGHYSDLVHFDGKGYAGFSSLADHSPEDIAGSVSHVPEAEVRSRVISWRERYIDQRFTWRRQTPRAGRSLRRGRRTIFVPLQDPYDEVSRLGHMTPAEIVATLQACLPPDDLVYVKRHPVDRSARTDALLASLAGDERFQAIDDAIHDAFAACDLVLTVNSGVGFEALLAGLAVVVAGKSDYNAAAVTVRNPQELARVLAGDALPAPPLAPELFLYHYFENVLIDPYDEATSKARIGRILDERLNLPARPERLPEAPVPLP